MTSLSDTVAGWLHRYTVARVGFCEGAASCDARLDVKDSVLFYVDGKPFVACGACFDQWSPMVPKVTGVYDGRKVG